MPSNVVFTDREIGVVSRLVDAQEREEIFHSASRPVIVTKPPGHRMQASNIADA